MQRLVRNLALGAALITVAVAIWRDYGVLVTLKRAAIAYLATFFVSGGLVLALVAGLRAGAPPPVPEADDGRERRGRWRPGRKTSSAGGAAPSAPPPSPPAESPDSAPAPAPAAEAPATVDASATSDGS